jgi:hypothetical protein
MSRGGMVLNVLLYQGVWLVAVLGAAAQHYSVSLLVAATAILWHLYTARAPRREMALIGIAALMGALFESALLAAGSVQVAPGALVGSVMPLWMVALWASFATTLNVSLRALRQRYLLCGLLAAVAAPLAYAAGARLGALHWVEGKHGLLMVAAGWGLLLPLLMKSAQRFDGFASA